MQLSTRAAEAELSAFSGLAFNVWNTLRYNYFVPVEV